MVSAVVVFMCEVCGKRSENINVVQQCEQQPVRSIAGVDLRKIRYNDGRSFNFYIHDEQGRESYKASLAIARHPVMVGHEIEIEVHSIPPHDSKRGPIVNKHQKLKRFVFEDEKEVTQ